MILRTLWIIAFILFFCVQARADKITSVSDGDWDDSLTWSGGKLPGFSFGDTVEINHCIFYNENLQLNSGAVLTINDSGKICGHHNIYMYPGSEFNVFGRFYFDSLFVQGGYFYVKNNNQAWVGQFIRVSVPGHSLIIGPSHFFYCPFSINCEFDCIPPLPSDSIANDSTGIDIEVYPNPFAELIYIKTQANINYIYLTDDAGRLILKKKFIENFIDMKNLSSGVYILNFDLFDHSPVRKKIIKL